MAELVDAHGSGPCVLTDVLVRLQSRAQSMYYTYVLRSIDGKHRYVGHCKNLNSQLNQHNSKNVKATRYNRPWKIVFSEKFKSINDAIYRERFLKSANGQNWLDEKGLLK